MRNHSRLTRAMALALAFISAAAFAARPLPENILILRLNGVPSRIGVIITAGSSTTNATTATPFTLSGGEVLKVVCDAAAVFGVGSSVSTTYTNAAFGEPMTAGVAKYFILRDTDTTIAVAAAASVNCAVFNML